MRVWRNLGCMAIHSFAMWACLEGNLFHMELVIAFVTQKATVHTMAILSSFLNLCLIWQNNCQLTLQCSHCRWLAVRQTVMDYRLE
jgi:hypothetical protein